DANGDGKPDIVQVKSGGREVCRTADLNFDGRLDRITFFDANGKIRRVESDFDRDGRIDELAFFDTGTLKEKHRATTLDGKLDTWEFYEKGQVARTERDENGDGFIDQWWEYPSRGCPLIHMDTDGDGRPDPGASIDYCKETGYSPPPLPNEEKGPEKPADCGKSPQRVIETDRTDEDFIAQWREYPTRARPLVHRDSGGAGRPGPGARTDYCKETGCSPPPLPNEEKGPEKPADVGKSPHRVIETDSTGEDDSST